MKMPYGYQFLILPYPVKQPMCKVRGPQSIHFLKFYKAMITKNITNIQASVLKL